MKSEPGTPHNPIDDLTEVRASPLHGLGVFARQDIPKGTIWWRAAPDRDVLLINKAQFETLRSSSHSPAIDGLFESIYTYCYFSGKHDALILILDNARYTNHSAEPNSAEYDEAGVIGSITTRDVVAGEELTEDYNTYDHCAWEGFEEMTWMPDR